MMVVDDNEIIRRSLRGLLESQAFVEVVCEGRDGGEAVAKAREYRPDVILMDVSMPVMDGLEATRIITREIPNVRVVVMSGEDSRHQALAAGASAFLMKSEVGQRLLTEVRKFEPQRFSEASPG